jgi:hypothetical protein
LLLQWQESCENSFRNIIQRLHFNVEKASEMKVWLLVVFILSGIYCHAQLSMQDSILYVRIESVDENGNPSKSNLRERAIRVKGDNLTCGHPHRFESIGNTKPDTISVQECRKFPIVSLKKLKSFLRKNYGYFKKTDCYNGRKYLQNLSHIYFVEEIDADRCSITEVSVIFILD